MLTAGPIPSSKPARRTSAGHDVHVPECSAPGARCGQRFSGGARRAALEPQALVRQARTRARLGEARLVPARDELQLVGRARRKRGQQHRVVVDRDDAVVLFLEEVASMTPIVRVLCAVKRSRSRAIRAGTKSSA